MATGKKSSASKKNSSKSGTDAGRISQSKKTDLKKPEPPSEELARKAKTTKVERKKQELTDTLSQRTAPSQETPSASEELARKAKAKKTEQKKQELTEALTPANIAAHDTSSIPSGDPEEQYFQDLGARIARRAYELHERRGRMHGNDLEDWLEAERQILSDEQP